MDETTDLGSQVPVLNENPVTEEVTYTTTPIVNNEVEAKDLYDAVAKLSIFNYIENTIFADGYSRKIDCFFVDKLTLSNDDSFHYIYGRDVTNISITQTVSSYGINAEVQITDMFGSLSSVAEQSNRFYFVISIFNLTEEVDKLSEGYMFHPYIFEVEDVETKSPDGSAFKVYKLKLKDIISSTLEKVCYGNLLLQYPNFVNSKNFSELFGAVLDFAGTIIKLSHNKKYKIDTKINFLDNNADSFNELIKSVILKDLPISMDCYKLLNHLYKHAVKELSIPDTFTGEKPANILIPLFVQDEIEDASGLYRSFFNRTVDKKLIEDITFSSENAPFVTHAKLIKRALFAKNLLMPFNLAFNPLPDDKDTEGKSIIYENINPPKYPNGVLSSVENIFKPMNGSTESPIEDGVNIPPSNSFIGLGWKNLSLISDTPDGANNLLIYFNWIYDFYEEVFLNKNHCHLFKNMKDAIRPTIDPHFHVLEKLELTGGDKDLFAKINSNTINLKSSDPLKEAMYHVGRALKSYIMLNSLCGFKLKGDLLRHPGEIIKMTSPTRNGNEETSASVVGGLSAASSGYVLLYTTAITHIFAGNQFKDLIYGTRICDIDTNIYEKSEY